MTLAVIGLGSNIDDPPQRLQEASHRLYMLPGLSNHRVSRVYSSPPMGPQDQPPFLNAVLTADCSNEVGEIDLLGPNHKVPGLRDLGTLRRRLSDHSLTTSEAFQLHL